MKSQRTQWHINNKNDAASTLKILQPQLKDY